MQLDVSDKPMVALALKHATDHHKGIKRKYCGEPYINHPIRVAERLLLFGYNSQEILSAALLHDCLEDESIHGHTMPEHFIAASCSPKVLRWVQLLSNTEKGNRKERKDAAAKRIATAPMEVQAIKLCDILDNCKGIASQDPVFAEVYVAEKQALLKAIPIYPPQHTMESMKEAVREVLAEEMNAVALWHLENGKIEQAKIAARDEEIAAIIAQQERSLFADVAIF